MTYYKRIFVIVLDSLGIGALPDSADYGDVGVDTFGHIVTHEGGLAMPHLADLGMLDLHPCPDVSGMTRAAQCAAAGIDAGSGPRAKYMRMAEQSHSKDTMTGHFELMGLYTEKPFQNFAEHGFPPELIRELEARCGKEVIGNCAASGTVILDELGEEEINHNKMIVYTSADSVLQICGNEETFDLENLYRCCEIARELTMRDEWKVGRVIARPYVGKKRGEFKRTANRRDYAVAPPQDTVMDALSQAGLDVIAVGKIHDIFSGHGITESMHSDSSVHGMEQTIEIARDREFKGLCFTNLVDFDTLWGHRRDPKGYGEEIERFDQGLGRLMEILRGDDLLILTADHGNDPTYTGTDHTREYVPFLAWSPSMTAGGALPESESFAAVGATICDNFGVPMPAGAIGRSVLGELIL